MAVNPGSEFNIAAGLNDPEVQRMLIAQEQRGADKVTNGFTDSDKMQEGQGGKNSARNDRFSQFMHMVEATDQLAAQQEFLAKLDRYEQTLDTAEVELQQEYERMLAEAYELRDGRKIFFSKDGSAYDKDGNKIDDGLIAHIPPQERDKYPSWEDVQQNRDQMAKVERDKQQIADAREKASDPDISEDELAALDKEIGQAVAEATAGLPSARAQLTNPADDEAPVFSADELAEIDKAMAATATPAAEAPAAPASAAPPPVKPM